MSTMELHYGTTGGLVNESSYAVDGMVHNRLFCRE